MNNFENTYNFARGTICVIRASNGKNEALKLFDEKWFREWQGCFSII